MEDVPEAQTQTAGPSKPEEEVYLYAGIRDRQLLQLGVPKALLPLVRSIKSEEQLDNAAENLPQEAYEALFFLAAGYSLEEVFAEVDKSEQVHNEILGLVQESETYHKTMIENFERINQLRKKKEKAHEVYVQSLREWDFLKKGITPALEEI